MDTKEKEEENPLHEEIFVEEEKGSSRRYLLRKLEQYHRRVVLFLAILLVCNLGVQVVNKMETDLLVASLTTRLMSAERLANRAEEKLIAYKMEVTAVPPFEEENIRYLEEPSFFSFSPKLKKIVVGAGNVVAVTTEDQVFTLRGKKWVQME